MQTDIPVLIVGAGPTGLLMATVLQRYGIPIRIIDKKTERTKTSNALGIHAATLELLADLDLIDTFIAAGKPINQACMYLKNKLFASIYLDTINSIYPYVLVVPQSQTEQILEEHLIKKGIAVQRDSALTAIKNVGDGYRITLQTHGQTDSFTTQYIIAADGGHSTVRGLTKIDFKGDEIPQQFVLTDSSVKTTLALNKIHAFYTDNGILALFPLPNGEVRLIGDIPLHQQVNRDPTVIENAVKTLAETRSNQQIQVQHSSWASTFWIHSKCIQNMHFENIFFAGDAAHIHSPIGGQGMNTGMQDAYNLGWKLALVLQGLAPKKILDSFNEERHPVVKNIVHQTDQLTRLFLLRNPVLQWLRNTILRPLLNTKTINHKIATHVAMLDQYYPKSSIIYYRSIMSNRSPQPGERVPKIKHLTPQPFADYLKGKNHQLLIFCGADPSTYAFTQIQQLIEMINHEYKDRIDVCLIGKNPSAIATTHLEDNDFTIHRCFNVERPALCLVRPDKYIAYTSAILDSKGLKKFLLDVFE